MLQPFNALRGRLLAAGIGSPQARRYLAELTDHLEDLVAEERRAGLAEEAAQAAARARLGAEDALFAAMVDTGRFRSWTARAPWAVLPGAALAGLMAVYGLVTLLLAGAVAGFSVKVSGHPMPPAWLPALADPIFAAVPVLAPVASAWCVGALALRQRLASRWIVVSMIGLALLGAALYCRADWPATARTWSFRVGSQLDDNAPALSWSGYSALALASLLASWLPYAALRRRLSA